MPPTTCLICNNQYTKKRSLTAHIIVHNLTSKAYYDQYVKTKTDGICLNCGKPTEWDKYRNYYYKFCSNNNRCYGDYTLKGHNLQDRIKTEQSRQTTLIAKYGTYKLFQLPEFQKKRKATNLKRFGFEYATQNKNILEKQQRSACHAKPYTLPSGKLVYKRGYEPQFLDHVFQNGILNEAEIDYSPNGIHYTGVDQKDHWYFPDFYIRKWNLIIECKSWWILKKQTNIIQELKEKACIDKGYQYMLLLDNDFTKLDQLCCTLK